MSFINFLFFLRRLQDKTKVLGIFMNEYLKVIENKDIEIVEREKNARLIFSQWKNSIQNYSGNQQ